MITLKTIHGYIIIFSYIILATSLSIHPLLNTECALTKRIAESSFTVLLFSVIPLIIEASAKDNKKKYEARNKDSV